MGEIQEATQKMPYAWNRSDHSNGYFLPCIFMYIIFLYQVLILNFQSYLIDVFIIRDLCEIVIGVLIPWVTFAVYFEC